MAASSWTLSARGLGRRARATHEWLLHDISLELRPGERVALSGPSGSGKTLLLRALALLDPLDAGELLWCGAPVRGDGVPAFRARALYVAQRPALFEGTVEQNLRRPYQLAAQRGASFDPQRVCALLEELARPPAFLAKAHRDLSGGEAQLVALVRALQLGPSLLLLDEPTASLDAGTARAVEGMVARWAAEHERALVWVSHDPAQAGRMASAHLELCGGRLVSA